MLTDNDKANKWIERIAEISAKVSTASKTNVVQTAIATIIAVNADDYTVRLLSSPDDGSQDFQAYSKTTEVLHVGDNVFVYYIGDLTNAYIEMLVDGGNVDIPYHMPDGGIPESDLSIEVQTKLNSSASAGRNLLDNWYFVGGGSQQNGGQFPINQRGQTSYSGAVYGIDRWKAPNSYSTVSLNSNSVTITQLSTASAGYRLWEQWIETFPNGAPCTASILVTAATGSFRLAFGSASDSTNRVLLTGIDSPGLYSVSGTLTGITDGIFSIITDQSGECSISIAAAKFEIGNDQTLCKNNNGTYYLYDIPNYQDQMLRCLSYCCVLNNAHVAYARYGQGIAHSTTQARIIVPFPTRMRFAPSSISKTGSIHIESGNTHAEVTAISIDNATQDNVNLLVTSTGLTAYRPYYLLDYSSGTSSLIISADL